MKATIALFIATALIVLGAIFVATPVAASGIDVPTPISTPSTYVPSVPETSNVPSTSIENNPPKDTPKVHNNLPNTGFDLGLTESIVAVILALLLIAAGVYFVRK